MPLALLYVVGLGVASGFLLALIKHDIETEAERLAKMSSWTIKIPVTRWVRKTHQDNPIDQQTVNSKGETECH